jgi:Protein of unknown function (DUF3866)
VSAEQRSSAGSWNEALTTFRTALVTQVLSARTGFQRLEVRIDGAIARAYNLTGLTGDARAGDQVICNTTAVELGLGTGGWHVVHWNLRNTSLEIPSDGHIMKLRYSSLQTNTGAAEEFDPTSTDITGIPIILCSLHSQMGIAAAAFANETTKLHGEAKRLAYVMTDGASLPIAFSDLVHDLRTKHLLCGTVTTGHAFGGEREAVNTLSGVGVAVREFGADAIVVSMGPGVVGTSSKLGTTAIEVAPLVDGFRRLGAKPIVSLRASSGDARPRHHGISHHSKTVLELCDGAQVAVPAPEIDSVRTALGTALQNHQLVGVDVDDPSVMFDQFGLTITSMGRGPGSDRAFFAFAAAAGVHGARSLK